MEILMRNQAIINFLKEVADAYRACFPYKYQQFLDIIAAESANLIKPSGMSADGSMLSYMKLPEHIYTFIKHAALKHLGIDDFFRDPENYHLLVKCWPDAKMKTKPTQTFTVPDLPKTSE